MCNRGKKMNTKIRARLHILVFIALLLMMLLLPPWGMLAYLFLLVVMEVAEWK